jgi:hypothetical protein
LVYDFKNVSNLPSPYYVRIYELLKQYEKIGERRFNVNELKEILGIQSEYKLYGHFKSKIIDKAQAKLAEHTDISFTYKEIKRGRAVEELVFHIKHNKPTSVEPDLFTEYDDLTEGVEENLFDPIFDTYFERLNEWWGISREIFMKKVSGKTADDIENAIEFTKERIRIGKAENPAGVFLDALSRGLKTLNQIKTEQKVEKERQEREKQVLLKPLLETYETLSFEFSTAVNNAIREITAENALVTEGAIERIKTAYTQAGNRKIMNKTLDDFRRDPFLRELVKSEIMKAFPDKFSTINEQFSSKMQDILSKIKEIDPAYPKL